MFKRLKNLVDLSRFKPSLESKPGQITLEEDFTLGDGNAEFLPDMTEREYQDYIRDEEQGWKGFRKRIGL